MIKLFYENRYEQPITEYTYGDDLYSEFIKLNESYYSYKLKLISEGVLDSLEKNALEWFNMKSKPYETKGDTYNTFADYHLNTMLGDMGNHQLMGFYNLKIHIGDIKSSILSLPRGIAKKIDKIAEIKENISDKALYKKLINPLHYYGELPQWFYRNNTVNLMREYLDEKTKMSIYEADYSVSDLLMKMKIELNKLKKSYTELQEAIKRERRELDVLESRFNAQIKDKQVVYAYKESLELIYRQISIYQRAIMLLYGRYLTEMTNVIRNLYKQYSQYSEGILR